MTVEVVHTTMKKYRLSPTEQYTLEQAAVILGRFAYSIGAYPNVTCRFKTMEDNDLSIPDILRPSNEECDDFLNFLEELKGWNVTDDLEDDDEEYDEKEEEDEEEENEEEENEEEEDEEEEYEEEEDEEWD